MRLGSSAVSVQGGNGQTHSLEALVAQRKEPLRSLDTSPAFRMAAQAIYVRSLIHALALCAAVPLSFVDLARASRVLTFVVR